MYMATCPPEFNVYKPSPHNDFMWVVEIIDPPSQGVYETQEFSSAVSRKDLCDYIDTLMKKWENRLYGE